MSRGYIAPLLSAVALMMVFIAARSAVAHPLHTSLAELTYDPAKKEVRVSLRVFVDDLTKAAAAYARTKPSSIEPPILAYARVSFEMAGRNGHLIPLASCGGRQVGDLMWLCFRAPLPQGIPGLRVLHRILFDLYSDQINIVQASYGGKKANLLFTRGDTFKRID